MDRRRLINALVALGVARAGAARAQADPARGGRFAPTDAIFTPPPTGVITVVLRTTYAFIRTACQQSPDTDLVRHLRLGQTPGIGSGSSSGGTVDPSGFRFIPKATPLGATADAYNKATSVQAGAEEAAALKINNMGVGGNHATICWRVTVAGGHGKTNVDVGSIYADGEPKDWIIARIFSPTQLIMEQVNLGTATAWAFPAVAPVGASFTHVSGGTHTAGFGYTDPTEAQLTPLNAGYVVEVVLDGQVICTTGYGLTATARVGNTGNGTLSSLSGLPPAMPGAYTLAFTSGTAFGVTDPNGNSIGAGALTASSAGSTAVFSAAGITLRVTAGPVAFVDADAFTIASVQTYAGMDGVYAGRTLVISEAYSILNPASQQASLIANCGADPPNYQRSDIVEQLRVSYRYTFDPWGAMVIGPSRVSAMQDFGRALPSTSSPEGDFWDGMQLQRFSLACDHPPGITDGLQLYVPDTPNPISGYLFQSFSDVTTRPANITVIPIADCGDPTNPPTHFCQRALRGGTVLWSELYGINPTYGLGAPSVAMVSKANVMFFTPAQKQYPVLIDYTAGDGVAGTDMLGMDFRAPFLPTDPNLSVPGVIVDMDGRRYCYITAHKSLVNYGVAVPPDLNGQSVTVIRKVGDIVVHSRTVRNAEIVITVGSGYGDAILAFDG